MNGRNGSKIFRKGRILKGQLTKQGYEKVNLYKARKMRSFVVHRLVAINFIDNVENKPEVNHIDGNKLNNKANNLEWVTSSENQIHAYKNELYLTTETSRNARRKSAKKFNLRKSKPIYQINKENGESRIWFSAIRASEIGKYPIWEISKSLNGKSKDKKYIWKNAVSTFDSGFLLIIEGCDCSGKTSLIDILKEKTGARVLRGSDFKIAENGSDGMFKYMMDTVSKNEFVILDRSFISNLVYAPLFDKNILMDCHVDALINKIKNKSFTIYLRGNEELIKYRLEKRGDEYISSKDIGNILQRYEDVTTRLKEKIEIIDFEISEYSSEDISKILLPVLRTMKLINLS